MVFSTCCLSSGQVQLLTAGQSIINTWGLQYRPYSTWGPRLSCHTQESRWVWTESQGLTEHWAWFPWTILLPAWLAWHRASGRWSPTHSASLRTQLWAEGPRSCQSLYACSRASSWRASLPFNTSAQSWYRLGLPLAVDVPLHSTPFEAASPLPTHTPPVAVTTALFWLDVVPVSEGWWGTLAQLAALALRSLFRFRLLLRQENISKVKHLGPHGLYNCSPT